MMRIHWNWSYPLNPYVGIKSEGKNTGKEDQNPGTKGWFNPKKKQTSSVIWPLLSLRQNGCEDLSHLLITTNLKGKSARKIRML